MDSDDTQSLIATYKKNQSELLKAVEDPEFLEKTLTKFFTTTSGTIEVPSAAKKMEFSLVQSGEDASKKLADLIVFDVAYVESRSPRLCIKSYLQGIEAQEKDGEEQTETTYLPNWSELCDLNKDLIRSERLQKANDYFSHLSGAKSHVCLIPDGIYFRVLRKGDGEPASSRIKKASFHYSYRIMGEKEKRHSMGTITEENPEHFISGMIHALVGMKRGEERLVTIHPKYGYGDHSFVLPNSVLIVKVQLIDFEEGDQEIAILPPYELEMKNIEEMQARYEELKIEQYHQQGRELCYEIKKCGDFIDFQLVKQSLEELLAADRQFAFPSTEAASEYSIDLKRFLYLEKYKLEALQTAKAESISSPSVSLHNP
jgi:FKBP-type peptidyl-prolyl cis-trans isomerase